MSKINRYRGKDFVLESRIKACEENKCLNFGYTLYVFLALEEVLNMPHVLPDGKIEQCPECGQKVVSYEDIYEGLQFDAKIGKRICPYCSYKVRQAAAIEDFLKAVPEGRVFNISLDGVKEEYLTLDALKEMFSFRKNGRPLYSTSLHLFGIETESNLAIIYWDYSYDAKFADSGGTNPYSTLLLSYEILRRFKVAIDYEDIAALWWAHTEIYKFTKDEKHKRKAEAYEAILRKNYGAIWSKDMEEGLAEKIFWTLAEIMKRKYIRPARAFTSKKEQAEKLLAFLHNPLQEKFTIDGISSNCDDWPIPADEKSFIEHRLDNSFIHQQALIFYEAWVESGEERFLREYLDKFEKVMGTGYITMPRLNESCSDVMGMLFSAVDQVIAFCKMHREQLLQWDNDDSLGEWDPGEEDYMTPPAVLTTYDFDGVLTKDCLAAFLKSSFDQLFSLYLVLNRLLYSALNGGERRLLLSKIHDLESQLDLVSGILYRQKLRLKEVELSRILRALEMMVESIDVFALQKDAQSELRRMFGMKKAVGSLIVTSNSEIEKLLTAIADKMATAVMTRCQDPTFNSVRERLKAELGHKVKYLTDESWRSLVTAEYLFKIFVASAPIDDSMDYSFISILYYRALEDSLNNLIYTPYVKQLPKNVKTRDTQPGPNDRDLDPFIPKNQRKNLYKRKGNKWILVNSLTLGTMGYILRDGAKEKVSEMIKFVAGKLKGKMDPGALLYELGVPICERDNQARMSIADRRNRAAHGGEIISYKDVTIDRGNVYAIENAAEYRRLLVLLLEALP